MTDRDFYDVLVVRAREIVRKVSSTLAEPISSDGKAAPHVAKERLRNLRSLAKQLEALANTAEVL